MLRTLIETLLANAWNGRLNGCEKAGSPPLSLPEDAVHLGHTRPLVPGEPEREFHLRVKDRFLHVVLTGATGSGKTTVLRHLLRADFAACRAVFLADFNGDLMDGALAVLASVASHDDLRGRLLMLDLRDPSYLPACNVLQVGAGEDAYTRALSLVEAIRRGSESWGVQLHETLLASLIALSEAEFTLLEVESLLSDAAFRAYISDRTTSDFARSFLVRYSALSEEKQALWRAPVLNKLSFLAHPDVRLLLGQRKGFSLRQFNEVPGLTVLVALDRPRLQGAADVVAGLLGSGLLQTVLGRSRQPANLRPFLHVVLDEAQNFASEELNVLLAEGRRYGAAISLAHQHLHQMPASTSHTIRNNCGTRMFFATGALDAAEIARELVFEVPPEEKAPDARTLLLTQPVGHCLVARRGQRAIAVQIEPPRPLNVGAGRIDAIRAIAYENFSRSRADIEEELRERRRWIAALGQGTAFLPDQGGITDHQPTPTTPSPPEVQISTPQSVEVRSGGRGRSRIQRPDCA